MRGRRRRRKLPAADGARTISARTPYPFASGALLKNGTPATIAETVFVTGARQQQIAGALKVGIEDYLAVY